MSEYNNPTPVAVAVVEVNDGENTLGFVGIRRKIEPRAGTLVFPGGYVNEMETAEVAAKREFEEETGIKLESDFQVMKTEITPRNEMLIFCRYHGTVHPELVLDAENDEVMEVVILKREDQLGFPLHDQLFKQAWESVL